MYPARQDYRWTSKQCHELIVAQEMMHKNAKVYMGARDSEKSRAAIKQLREETGKDVNFIPLDLSDLHQVRKAAESFLR